MEHNFCIGRDIIIKGLTNIMGVILSLLFVIGVLVGILALCRWLILYRSGEEYYSDIKDEGNI